MELRPETVTVGRFIRRLFWRSEPGPATIEALVEVRELVSDDAPITPRSPPDPGSSGP